MREIWSPELVAALERGDVARVKRALDDGTSPDGRDAELWTVLMVACRAGHLDMVECLLAAGADVNDFPGLDEDEDTGEVAISPEGLTPMELEQARAALEEHSPLRPWQEKLAAKYHPEDPLLNLRFCEDALTTALVFGHGNIARTLIHAGAQVTGETCPLLLAAATGQVELIELLLEKGAPLHPRDRVDSPLFAATMRNQKDAVRALLAAGADVNFGGIPAQLPLMIPAMVGDLEMARLLVDAGADVQLEDSYGHSAISVAREQGHDDVYQFLVRAMGARP